MAVSRITHGYPSWLSCGRQNSHVVSIKMIFKKGVEGVEGDKNGTGKPTFIVGTKP